MIANYPNGESETLIDVPEYDFDWQFFYYPDKTVSLPAGTRLDIVAHYDNSELNPKNPDPNRAITFGTKTNDEMMFTVFEFIPDVGVRPTPATDETRRDALIASLPPDSVYIVDLPMMGNALPTALASAGERRGHVVYPDAWESPRPPGDKHHVGWRHLHLRHEAAGSARWAAISSSRVSCRVVPSPVTSKEPAWSRSRRSQVRLLMAGRRADSRRTDSEFGS